MKTARQMALAAVLAAAAWCSGVREVAAAGLCAEVQLVIPQTMTLERQGFDAMMRIKNGITMYPLTNINIRLTFTDVEGDPVNATSDSSNTNAYFFHRVDTMDGIASITEGTVGAGQTAEIHWLIIPAIRAGGTNSVGVQYAIGAELEYWLNGDKETVTVQADYITVHPMPKLQLDYFLPGTVYGDDPWTDEIEDVVPFPLGLRMKNGGAGAAWKLKIESAQPKITENKQGLLVGFSIEGADVNGEGVEKTLTADFGTLAPDETKVAKWMMTASLFGTFTNFSATYTHSDELGGELTSLIDSVHTHLLLKDVRVDLAGRDRIYDFLAQDGTAVTAYESDGGDLEVTDGSGTAVLKSTDPYIWRLDTVGNDEALYVKKSFAAATNTEIQVAYAVRDDGKKLPTENMWLHRTRENGESPWEGWFSLFDADGAGHSYLTVLTDIVAESNRPPNLQFIPTKIIEEGQRLEFLVEATDADGTIPELAAYAMPAGASFTPAGDGSAWFVWTAPAGSHGVWPIRFTASDGEFETFQVMRIYVGEPGEGDEAVPASLAGWAPEFDDLLAQTLSGIATAEWQGEEGMLYDVYVADDAPSGKTAWTLLRENVAGHGLGETNIVDDVDLGTERMRRFYRLTFAGEEPDHRGVWGVLRREIPPAASSLMSVPLRLADRRFAGRMGAALAECLDGSDEGPGTGGTEVYLFDEAGGWVLLYLDAEGVWRDVGGVPTDAELAPGQGFWVVRSGTETVKATFAGRVGAVGEESVALHAGYNLVGVAEGVPVPLPEALGRVAAQSGTSMETADCVMLAGANGWRTLMFLEGAGEDGAAAWVDVQTSAPVGSNELLEPGTAFYYLRRGDSTELAF